MTGPASMPAPAEQDLCGCAAAQAAADRTRFEQVAALAALLTIVGSGSLIAYAVHAAGAFTPHLP